MRLQRRSAESAACEDFALRFPSARTVPVDRGVSRTLASAQHMRWSIDGAVSGHFYSSFQCVLLHVRNTRAESYCPVVSL